jgi:hypothetical protein
MPFGSACWATWPAWCKSLTALLSLPAACAASHCCGPSLEWAAVNCEEWDEAQVEQLLRFLHLSSLHLRSYFQCLRRHAACLPACRSCAAWSYMCRTWIWS